LVFTSGVINLDFLTAEGAEGAEKERGREERNKEGECFTSCLGD
jgi:hypothetical protein